MKNYLVQIIKTDKCYLHVQADNRTDAIEKAQEMVSEGALDDKEWEPIDGYQYYPTIIFGENHEI